MSSLYKKEVLVRGNSNISKAGAISFTRNFLDRFQEADKNKDKNGNYIDYFFADLFDARDMSLLRVYAEPCRDKYNMDTTEYLLTEPKDSTPKIVTNCEIYNDTVDIVDNKGTLMFEPLGGIIGGTCNVDMGEAGIDEVHCTSLGKSIEVIGDEDYADATCVVSYLKQKKHR